ncbi:MAG: LD-carboxypeptidase, partial [Firmicutes bacterium]|nr:LD-carboxypeptidase [Bacillota bacterium]
MPKPLKKGSTVALIAPSSPPASGVLGNAIESIKEFGLEPKLFPSCVGNYGYLAGKDEIRARDVENAFADDSVSGIICLRGGYGTPRLLNLLNYDIINKNPKRFFGYSDITALHT